jgi:biopolymer transport protein ExbD
MAIRDDLKANLDVALAGSTVSVSSELPWSSAGEPLYIKNMKKVYLDEDNIDKTELFSTLDGQDVTQTETAVTAFLAVDAKTQPSDIDNVISKVLESRGAITGQTSRECDMNTDTQADTIVYQFDFNFKTV